MDATPAPVLEAAHPDTLPPGDAIDLAPWRIDRQTQETLRALWPRLAGAVDPLLDEFAGFAGRLPGASHLVAGEDAASRLGCAQKEHWRRLFAADFDAEYRQRAATIGRTHGRIGLKPSHYLSGQSLVLERLVQAVIALNRRNPDRAALEAGAVIRALLLDSDRVLTTHAESATADLVRDEMQDLAELFEHELDEAVDFVRKSASGVDGAASEVVAAAAKVSEDTDAVTSASEMTNVNAQMIAGAAEQLSASISEISQQIERSTGAAHDAADRSAEAQNHAAVLASLSDRIGSIVQLIERIAKETRLLALNATIEAARAGDAGRGFAVVAGEVKSLADQTNGATGNIRAEIHSMQSEIRQTVEAIGKVAHRIEAVSETITAIAGAVTEQEGVTRIIAENANDTAGSVRAVHEGIASVAGQAGRSSREAARLRENSRMLIDQVIGIKRRVVATLRSTRFANRRREERIAVDLPVTCAVDGRSLSSRLDNLSMGGAQVRQAGLTGSEGKAVTLDIPDIGRLPGTVAAAENDALHIRFEAMDTATEERLYRALEGWKRDDVEMVALAKDTARQIGQMLEAALNRREVTWDDLFDVDYQPVPDTDPQQHLTRFTALCDRMLPPIQEALLNRNPRLTFCAAVDRNGYLPTHNTKYSEPQRPGQTAWNTAHCRNRRIFGDRTGLAAAHNRTPVLVQTYRRDMGGGEIVTMKDISAPVLVNGQHWGAFRIGARS